ncbi:endonuclease/exonuclease/phosphatase family metal-dependent hydrolase [Desulfohalotomaculum tongense]|uniref:endonuclease/exonuclease/phosphatase family protein n=1 Tax=Desulforadius tongensis TaxID=1216062 RepID=UPI001959682F|nr:endonuclease/exonuclease/phosphatase family protein [Desulforadius tongensis]MBM7854817.1 endonuclease/exonuclease/phosphatase family metal-dependent hydrolase [Desulforadius tongensis]
MPKAVRVLTYNIRHGVGTDNRLSLERIAWVIYSSGADICGIQEVDKWNPRSGMCNQAKRIAELCGMDYVFGPNIHLAGIAFYGTAVLSRWPIVDFCNYKLPGKGESRGLLKAEVKINDVKISFFNTHLGLDQDSRIKQAKYIKEIIDIKEPVILTGDLNEQAGGKAVKILLKDGFLKDCLPCKSRTVNTYPSHSPTEKIDYILADKKWHVKWARVISSRASDHLPYLAELVLSG